MRPHRLQVTAFGAFAEHQDIDLDRLAEEGLFLIHGRTGAGKTTLLDAIVFALYGEVGHRGSDRLVSHHVEIGTTPRVELEFTIAGHRYRVTRSPSYVAPKKGGGTTQKAASATLVRLEPDGTETVLGSKQTDVNHEIQSLVGLNHLQFSQVMLLPQGRFEQVLRAKSDERQKLLDTLFDTSLYASATQWLEARAGEQRKILEGAGRDLEAVMQQALDLRTALLQREDQLDLSEPDDSGPDITWLTNVVHEVDQAATLAVADAESARATEATAASMLTDAKLTLSQWDQADRARSNLRQLAAAQPEIDQLEVRLAEFDAANAIAVPLRDEHNAKRRLDTAWQRLTEAVATIRTALDEATVLDEGFATLSIDTAVDIANFEAGRVEPFHQQVSSIVAIARAGLEQRARLSAELEQANAARTHTAQELADAEQRERSTIDTISDLEQRHRELSAQLDTESEVAAQLELRQADLSRLEAQLGAAKSIARLEQQRQTAESTRQAAVDAHQAAVDDAQALRGRYFDGIAAVLAASLTDGEPCSVCGSLDHPSVAQSSDDAVRPDDLEAADGVVETLAAEREQATTVVSQLTTKIAEQRGILGEVSEASSSVEVLSDRRADLEASVQAAERAGGTATRVQRELQEVDGSLIAARAERAEATALRAELAGRQATEGDQIAQAQAALDQLGDMGGLDATRAQQLLIGVDTASHALRSAATQHRDAASELDRARIDAENAVRGSTFADRATPTAILSAYQREGGDRDVWFARINDHHHGLDSATELLAHDWVTALPQQRPSVADAESAARFATDASRRASTRETHLKAARDDLRKLSERFDTQLAQYEVQRSTVELLSHVADRVAGKRKPRVSLQRWVLRSYLEEICEYANQRLVTMTSGRFRLEVRETPTSGNSQAGLDLDVFDAHTGQTRNVTTLSGGETFQASLALALGVADTVSAHHGGIRLDALFVDEGFGSLDPESLQLAMDELDRLREGGRMVGLISHVGALRERIGFGVEVIATPKGSIARLGEITPA